MANKILTDTVTFSDRSSNNSKYGTVLRCEASDAIGNLTIMKSVIVDTF